MKIRLGWLCLVASFVSGLIAASALAGPDWRRFIPFQSRVEYDERKDYVLHDGNGPWMILAATFSGPSAEKQARALIKELRTRFNLQAYWHNQVYDFTERMEGKGFAPGTRRPPKMRYYKELKSNQIAVLVGNFNSIDDPDVARTLKKVKLARPNSLLYDKNAGTRQQLALLREVQRALSGDQEKRQKGPMSSAFVSRNPLLPKEYFVPQGLDTFVYNLNKDVQYSLLKNPGQYTVRVASFRGISTMKVNEAHKVGVSDKLHRAGQQAHDMVMRLRRKGVEAYEFHDRHESLVTVGHFDKLGTQMPDGQIELLPQIHQIMTMYGAKRKRTRNGQVGMYPSTIGGIPFDVQPAPVKVPRASVGRDYARSVSYRSSR